MSFEIIDETTHYNLVLSPEPVTEQFAKHPLVFQVRDKKHGTIQSEVVFYPQAQQVLQYTERLHAEVLAGLVDLVEDLAVPDGEEEYH